MSYLIKNPMELERLRAGTLTKQFKGGDGGSAQREATAEERRLWAAQAASLEGMNAVAMPTLTTGMSNLSHMANEANDGSLGTRLRNQALNDVNVSLGTSANDIMRNFGSYGTNFNPNRTADIAAQWGLGAAKQRAGAANLATMGAEDMKWNRNAALTGLASGQGAQSINGMGQLSAQIASSRNNANNMAMQDQANTTQGLVGLGSFGAYLMKKDGGRVSRFAGGGLARFSPVSMPKIAPYNFAADTDTPNPDGGMMQTVAGAAVPTMGTRMMANGLDKVGISAPKQSIDGLTTAAKDVISSFGTDATMAPIAAEKAGEAALAADTAATTGAAADAWAAGELAADAALATEATTAGAASGLGSAAMAAAPWLIGGYALGSMLDLWADGGQVSGPGTGTSDSIPAMLSDGEAVVNTRAMGLSKAETRRVVDKWQKGSGGADDLVLAINDRGLEMRHGKVGAAQHPHYEGAAQKFAGGGLAALGHIARGFVPTAMQMDQQKKADDRWERQDARTQTMHDRQIGMLDNADAQDKAVMGAFKEFAAASNGIGQDVAAVITGNMTKAQFNDKYAEQYNQHARDGRYLFKLADGTRVIADNAAGQNAKPISDDDAFKTMSSPQTARAAHQQFVSRLASISPKYADMAMRAFQSGYEREEKLGDEASRRDFDSGQLDKRFTFESGQTDKKMSHDLGMTKMKIGAEDRRHAETIGLGMEKINAGYGAGSGASSKLAAEIASKAHGMFKTNIGISGQELGYDESAQKKLMDGNIIISGLSKTGRYDANTVAAVAAAVVTGKAVRVNVPQVNKRTGETRRVPAIEFEGRNYYLGSDGSEGVDSSVPGDGGDVPSRVKKNFLMMSSGDPEDFTMARRRMGSDMPLKIKDQNTTSGGMIRHQP